MRQVEAIVKHRYTLLREMSSPITSCISPSQSKLGFNFSLNSVQSTPPCTSERLNEKSEFAFERNLYISQFFYFFFKY